MEKSIKILLDRCSQLYSMDTDSSHGYVHVSRLYDVEDTGLFFNKDLVYVEVYGNADAYGKFANSYIAATLTVFEFKMHFETECRIPIYYRL